MELERLEFLSSLIHVFRVEHHDSSIYVDLLSCFLDTEESKPGPSPLGKADNIRLLNNTTYVNVDLTLLIREIILNKLGLLLLPFAEKEDIRLEHHKHMLNGQTRLDRAS
jgi:hypothetical protein